MTTTALKNKIYKSIGQMDATQLQSAWFILREICNQQKYSNVKMNKHLVDQKIAIGTQQLDNNEGTDFRDFLNEMQVNYGRKQ